MAARDDAIALELRQGIAHRGAADGQPPGQLRFGWQGAILGSQGFVADPAQQLLPDLFHQWGGPLNHFM